jgi:hypothetical protein
MEFFLRVDLRDHQCFIYMCVCVFVYCQYEFLNTWTYVYETWHAPPPSFCVCVCIPYHCRAKDRRNRYDGNECMSKNRIVGRVVLYSVRVASKESRRLVIPRTSCSEWYVLWQWRRSWLWIILRDSDWDLIVYQIIAVSALNFSYLVLTPLSVLEYLFCICLVTHSVMLNLTICFPF